jgi:hypothetical protein
LRVVIVALLGTSVFAQPPVDPAAAAPTAADDNQSPFPIEERWRHYVHRTYSWQRMAMLGVDSVFDQFMREPREWGRGPASYGYRYGSGFGRRFVRNSIELGAGIALKEDTRFRPSGEKGLLRRIRYASTNAFLARGPDGERTFAYSRLAATVGAPLIASTWHPCHRSPGHYAESVGFGYLGHLQNSLLTEFSPDMIRLGKRVRARFLGR